MNEIVGVGGEYDTNETAGVGKECDMNENSDGDGSTPKLWTGILSLDQATINSSAQEKGSCLQGEKVALANQFLKLRKVICGW